MGGDALELPGGTFTRQNIAAQGFQNLDGDWLLD